MFMAIYKNGRKWLECDPRPIMDYYVDSVTDVNNLPDNTRIRETSIAYVPSTGEIYVLMGNEWRLM